MSPSKLKCMPIAYSDVELAWIEVNQAGISRKELSQQFNAKFGRSVTRQHITGLCKRNKWANGRNTCFKQGQKSWNKGVTGYMGANKTSFKKGRLSHNHKPVGHERLTKDGYIMIKVAEPNKFRLKQLVVWERYYGKLPSERLIRFLDEDRSNCNIDNLMIIPRAVHFVVNNYNPANTKNRDLNKSILLTETINYHAKKRSLQHA